MTIGPGRTRLILDNNPMRSWSSIDIRSAGIDLAYEVFWRVGEREWFVGEGFVGADAYAPLQYGGSYGGFKGRESELAGFDPATERVDIVLRPSAAVARRLMGFEKIWGGTVVIKDVPLSVDDRRSPPP